MDKRYEQLLEWLNKNVEAESLTITPIAGDASFRRYFRVSANAHTWVAMDAPPDKENCVTFIAVAKALRDCGLSTPEIFKQNITDGFLLLSDFGDKQLLQTLNEKNVARLYNNALDALAVLQNCRHIDGCTVPAFTRDFMFQELLWFKEWFIQRYLHLELSVAIDAMLTNVFNFLANLAASQPQVFMHRDYHSANLMLLPDEKIGILDFQDAFIGPVMYDVVSLLRDCYIDWPDELVMSLALSYKLRLDLKITDELFLRWFNGMGLQRHMKALLTFSRKYKRDHNSNYLVHIPRTLNYIAKISRFFPECQDFQCFLNNSIYPAYEKEGLICAE
jgi:aminoglycoside/choline kinase family phosphotransferase